MRGVPLKAMCSSKWARPGGGWGRRGEACGRPWGGCALAGPTRTQVAPQWCNQTGGGFKQYTGLALITNLSDSSPNDAAAELSFDIQMTGALTRASQ